MQPVHRRQDINERTTRAAREVKASAGKPAPGEELPGKKQQTERGGESEPWEMALVAERNSPDRFDWRQGGLPCDGAARQVDGEAADNKDGRIGQQDCPW